MEDCSGYAHVPEHFRVQTVRVGRDICRKSNFTRVLFVAVMCKQLYWNWVSSFTSGIHLEEHQAADGRALRRQAESQQVPVGSLWDSYLLLGSGSESWFLIFGYSDTFYITVVILSCEDKLKILTLRIRILDSRM